MIRSLYALAFVFDLLGLVIAATSAWRDRSREAKITAQIELVEAGTNDRGEATIDGLGTTAPALLAFLRGTLADVHSARRWQLGAIVALLIGAALGTAANLLNA